MSDFDEHLAIKNEIHSQHLFKLKNRNKIHLCYVIPSTVFTQKIHSFKLFLIINFNKQKICFNKAYNNNNKKEKEK